MCIHYYWALSYKWSPSLYFPIALWSFTVLLLTMQGATREQVPHTAFHSIKVQHYCDSICGVVPCAWSTSRAIPPTPGRWAELIWDCICLLYPKLLINTGTIHTSICGNWILQALLPHVFQSLLKGERSRSLEISVSRDREKVLPLMHGCHSKTILVLCKGREKVKVWT